jgi:hypothetical protein
MSLLNRLLELQKENNPESPYRDVQSKLDELKRKYSKHLDVGCYAYYGYIKLEWLLALKTAPIGTGSSYMRDLCNIADEYKLTIMLHTSHKGYGNFDGFKKTTSESRIQKFYKRFGFVSNYSKRDYRPNFQGNMHRYPKNI